MAGPYVLVGSGIQAIATPAALVVTITVFGNRVSQGSADPPNYRNVGMLRPADADGWFDPVGIHGSPQKIVLPAGCTQLGYAMIAGSVVSVAELAAPPPLASSLNPWDRNPAIHIEVGGASAAGGTASTTYWSFTVPVGKVLRVFQWSAVVRRSAAASALSIANTFCTVNNRTVLSAVVVSNGVGDGDRDSLDAGPADYPAGTVLEAAGQNADTGGNVFLNSYLHGVLFDA